MKRLGPCVAGIFALAAGLPARALTIDATLTGFDPAEARVIDFAAGYWERAILDPFTVSVSFKKVNLGADFLGLTSGFVAGIDGRPKSATVSIADRENEMFGWFVDPTPADNAEFAPGYNAWDFRGDAAAPAGRNYDLLTVAFHELGHVVGFSSNYRRFASKIGPGAGSLRSYDGEAVSATLTPVDQGTHLSDSFHPYDLMNAFQNRGERLFPSDLDLAIEADAFGYSVHNPTPAAVPEPETWALIFAGLLTMRLGVRRRAAIRPRR